MEDYIAEIRLFAATYAPKNWAFCQGQLLSISQNQALFSLLGTTYGGNGTTSFGLPDLRGRTAIGVGNGAGLPSFSLGQLGGENNHTLISSEMPAHTHIPSTLASTNLGATNDPTNGSLASSSRSTPLPNIYSSGVANTGMGTGSITVGVTGEGQPHQNMQPYLGMNYIICLYGIYPSRN